MSPDTKFNTCSIEQELSDDDIDRELRRAEALELVRLRSVALQPACCFLTAARAFTVMLRRHKLLGGHPAACAFLLSLQHKLYSLTLPCAGCTCTSTLHPPTPDGFADNDCAWLLS